MRHGFGVVLSKDGEYGRDGCIGGDASGGNGPRCGAKLEIGDIVGLKFAEDGLCGQDDVGNVVDQAIDVVREELKEALYINPKMSQSV